MTVVLLIVRLALAGVLALAAAGKIADRRGARAAAAGLGAPARLAAPLAVALPLAELALAAGLLVPATAAPAAAATVVLLGVFSAAIASALRRGRAVACHCFGALSSSRPAGPRTIARNAVLMAGALAVVVAGRDDAGPSAVAWVAELGAGEAVALAAALVAAAAATACAMLALRLLRAHGHALVRLDAMEAALRGAGLHELLDEALAATAPPVGPPLGAPAPPFALEPAAGGGPVALDDLLAAERPVVAVFADADCGPCRALVPRLAAWQREHAGRLTIALLGGGDRERLVALAAEHGLDGVLSDPDLTTYRAYAMAGTPGAVLVGADGAVAAPAATGADDIAALVARATTGPLEVGRWHPRPEPEGLPAGTPAPDLVLTGADGHPLALSDALGGRPSVLLFWNPGCGFCRNMRDDLAAWPEDAPALHVVTREPDPDLPVPALLDPEGTAAAAFGAGGTPMAVLLDVDGRVAAPLAGGRDEVLGLAGSRTVAG